MLERTAGCLESGSLRRLVPGSNKSLKSQRMLHSTFWIHGAGELDLPPLWAALTGEYDITGEVDSKEMRGSSTLASNSGFLLDFLYPSGAFTFLRQFSGWPLAWQGSNNRNTQSTRVGYRLFSSAPTAITENGIGSRPSPTDDTNILFTEDRSVFDEKSSIAESRDEQEKEELKPSSATISLIQSMSESIELEDAWRQYQDLPTEQSSFVVPALLEYLSTSEDPLFVERVITLFNMIPKHERDSSTWQIGAKAFIALGRLAEASEVQRAALTCGESSVSVVVIAAQLKASQWHAAYSTYTAHLEVFPSEKMDPDFAKYTGFNPEATSLTWVKAISDPFMRELSAYWPALPFAVMHMFKSEIEFNSEMRQFVIKLAYHALNPGVGHTDGTSFIRLLKSIREWEADIPQLYRHLIEELHEQKFIGLMIYVYNEFRERHRPELSRRIVHFMAEVFCDLHDVGGIQQVLDDCFYCFGGPDKFTYRKCLWEFAWQADAPTVEVLFEQYTNKFYRGPDSTAPFEDAIEFTPLLNAYAKSGDLRKVISLFEDISSKHKLEPTLECWNILLNAYGKVHNIDGAFKRFEELLDSPLQPDYVTFGTMMGICVRRGDRESTLELFQMATDMGIPISTAMMDCLVIAYIRDDKIAEAQEICEKALQMELICPQRNKTPRTNMWNQLLLGHAFRGDLKSVQATLKRMQRYGIEYDQYTYSALMEALARLKLATRTWRLLTKVMPEAGIPANSFHYAVVMGACLSTGELDLLFQTYDLMLSRNTKPNASTSFLALKANAELNERQPELKEEGRLKLAEEYFDQVIGDSDARRINPSIPQKDMGKDPVDIAYNTSMFRFMIHIYGPKRMMARVEKLFDDYIESLPEHRQYQNPPIRMLEALMEANLQDENYEGVEQCWKMAFENAKKEAIKIGGANKDSDAPQALAYHKFSLAMCLSTYMTAMDRIRNDDKLKQVVAQVQEAGFALDCRNENMYIQSLVRAGRVQQAFHICETKLMQNWAGWFYMRSINRGQISRQSRLSIELRALKRYPGYMRPYDFTLLVLARGWLDANVAAAEDPHGRVIVDKLKKNCPKVVSAILAMPRNKGLREKSVLTGNAW